MAKVVILSTADMNAAVWTNKQHLAVRLAEFHDVTYVESLGLRRPKINLSDIKRIINRIIGRRLPRGNFKMPQGLKIISPHVFPVHALKPVQKINSLLLRRQIEKIVSDYEGYSILWTFSPITYGIEEIFDSVVYHSVDLLHELEGLPREHLLRDEKILVSKANVVIASSSQVRQHLRSLDSNEVTLWENVADTDLYSSVKSARQPRAVFAGNLTPGKVDFGLLKSVADRGVQLVLAGPAHIDGVADGDQVKGLIQHPNVTYVGNLQPLELARLLNSCTVGLIPYSINPYTTGVFPMKVYEYLASGLSVVSTPLPSLAETSNPSLITAEGIAFVSAVLDNIHLNAQAVEDNRIQATGHSWTARTEQAVALLKELETSRG